MGPTTEGEWGWGTGHRKSWGRERGGGDREGEGGTRGWGGSGGGGAEDGVEGRADGLVRMQEVR